MVNFFWGGERRTRKKTQCPQALWKVYYWRLQNRLPDHAKTQARQHQVPRVLFVQLKRISINEFLGAESISGSTTLYDILVAWILKSTVYHVLERAVR